MSGFGGGGYRGKRYVLEGEREKGGEEGRRERERERCVTSRLDECACVHACVWAAGGWMVADSFRVSAWSVVISPFSERLFTVAWTWAQQIFPALCDSAYLAMGICLGVAI